MGESASSENEERMFREFNIPVIYETPWSDEKGDQTSLKF